MCQVSVGDELLVDGGIISFVVRGKTDTDVQVRAGGGGGGATRSDVGVYACSAFVSVYCGRLRVPASVLKAAGSTLSTLSTSTYTR